MLYPSINELRKKVDSKYTLVSLAAKRARDLIDGKPPLVSIDIDKPVIHRDRGDRRGPDHISQVRGAGKTDRKK